MPNICSTCFADKEIKGFINSQPLMAHCDFCNTDNVPSIALDELYGFFEELLACFEPDPAGQTLKAIIQGYWTLFSSMNIAYAVLNRVMNDIQSQFNNADETVAFSDEILENVGFWDVLKKRLVEEARFLTDINQLTDDYGWDAYFNSQIVIPHGTQLFRARLHGNSGDNPFDAAQMFCPPKHLCRAGRANPAGIPMLYLSDNEETVLYEVRAGYLDELSIGTFVVQAAVVDPVKIADFTDSGSIFYLNEVSAKIKATLLKQKISDDLSKPMRRYDSELDYIPTQFICEFIKIYTGVKGIKFRSSLHNTGNNFVLFDPTLMECIDVKTVKVRKTVITV